MLNNCRLLTSRTAGTELENAVVTVLKIIWLLLEDISVECWPEQCIFAALSVELESKHACFF